MRSLPRTGPVSPGKCGRCGEGSGDFCASVGRVWTAFEADNGATCSSFRFSGPWLPSCSATRRVWDRAASALDRRWCWCGMTRGAYLHALSGQGPFGFAGKTIYVHGITTITALLDQTQRFRPWSAPNFQLSPTSSYPSQITSKSGHLPLWAI
jgi:hypothetical protein